MGHRINSLFDEREAEAGDLIARNLHGKNDPLLDNMETDAEAAASSERVIKQLIRCNHPNAFDLAARLQKCSTISPCGSGICPLCDLARRKVMIALTNDALSAALPLTWIWLEPRAWRTQIGTLANVNLQRLALSRERDLKRALPDIAQIGVVDVSLRGWDHEKGEWQFSIALLAEAANSRELRDAVRKRFPGDPAWSEQHSFRQVHEDDRLREMCCLLKPAIGRPPAVYGAEGYSEAMTGMTLRNAALEVMLCLHQFPIHKRIILSRLSRMGVRDWLRLRRRDPVAT